MRSPASARQTFFGALLWASATISPAQSPELPLKKIAPGVFQIGAVRLNPEHKTIHFPATVNMTNGAVEYLVVTGTGKLHESVLKTEVEASQIHVAMLFIGARVATNSVGTNITGDQFSIEVSWKADGAERRVASEELVFNSKTQTAMSKGAWIYNGSKIVDGTFIAQRDGSLVSIITDPLALANNPRPGRDDDEIWFVNTNSIPPLNSSVEVTFRLEVPQKSAKDTK